VEKLKLRHVSTVPTKTIHSPFKVHHCHAGATLVSLNLSFSQRSQDVRHYGPMAVPLPQDFACNISDLPSLGGPYPPGHPNFKPRSLATLDKLIVVARSNEVRPTDPRACDLVPCEKFKFSLTDLHMVLGSRASFTWHGVSFSPPSMNCPRLWILALSSISVESRVGTGRKSHIGISGSKTSLK
jgi:hypothetical protein